jgi:hypothetical protein
MRILERLSTPSGTEFRALSLGSQSFCDTQHLLDRMAKHVGSDGSVHRLCVEFENTRVNISHERELCLVAQLAVAYNNSLTAEQFQHEKDLYGQAYAEREEGVYAAPSLEVGEPLGQSMYTQKTDWKTKRDKNKRKQVVVEGAQGPAHGPAQAPVQAPSKHKNQHKNSEWDEELLGDRFVYDPLYEQHEELVPWKMPDTEERFGWYQ